MRTFILISTLLVLGRHMPAQDSQIIVADSSTQVPPLRARDGQRRERSSRAPRTTPATSQYITISSASGFDSEAAQVFPVSKPGGNYSVVCMTTVPVQQPVRLDSYTGWRATFDDGIEIRAIDAKNEHVHVDLHSQMYSGGGNTPLSVQGTQVNTATLIGTDKNGDHMLTPVSASTFVFHYCQGGKCSEPDGSDPCAGKLRR